MDQLVERVRLDRRARFRGDEEETALGRDAREEGFDRVGDGRVEDVEPALPRFAAEGLAEHVGPERRAAHAEDDGGIGGMRIDRLAQRRTRDRFFGGGRREVEPAEPARLVGVRKERSVALPEATRRRIAQPAGLRGPDGFCMPAERELHR